MHQNPLKEVSDHTKGAHTYPQKTPKPYTQKTLKPSVSPWDHTHVTTPRFPGRRALMA